MIDVDYQELKAAIAIQEDVKSHPARYENVSSIRCPGQPLRAVPRTLEVGINRLRQILPRFSFRIPARGRLH
jgi:hypothetical protein